MFKNVKGFLVGFLLCIIIFALGMPIFAAPVEKLVNAVYKDIKIIINETELIPTDAAGKKVEPFVIDGTTYLPVRAISEAFGMKVTWDSNTNTVLLEGIPKLSVKGTSKLFEESFINKPLDEKWTKSGSITFDGENGLNIKSGANLTLEGFSIERSNNFSVDFEAYKVAENPLFYVSFGVNERGELLDWIGVRYGSLRYNDRIIASFATEEKTWYRVKIDVINNQANIYIDDILITSQKLDDTLKRQFSFVTEKYKVDGYNIRNFKIAIND